MLARGLTAETLADAAGVSRGTSYNALHGKPVRLRTADFFSRHSRTCSRP